MGRGRWARSSLAAFGVAWLALEPVGFFLGGDWSHYGWLGYLGLVVVSAIAGYGLALPRLPIERALAGSKVRVRIAEGDLLDQQGNLVIGVSDCFDTALTGGIISPRSLQGQALERLYGGEAAALDADIEEALRAGGAQGAEAGTKSYGKRVRFDIGTTAVVERDQRRLFLLVYGRMPDRPPIQVEVRKEDFHLALVRLWEAVREWGQRDELHVPLLGGNFARLRSTRTQLVQTIALSFIAAQGPAEVAPVMTLWLRQEEMGDVDLPALTVWLNSVCGA